MERVKSEPLPLRERKKRKVATELQAHAIRLFNRQGFAKTSVEQIAAAAEVSTSTFFRYFTTKEAVVSYGPYNELIIETFKRQPKDISTIEALQNSVSITYRKLTQEEATKERRRFECIQNDPDLRVAIAANLAVSQPKIAKWLMTHKNNEEEANLLAGILIGIGVAIFLSPSSQDYLERFDQSLKKVILKA